MKHKLYFVYILLFLLIFNVNGDNVDEHSNDIKKYDLKIEQTSVDHILETKKNSNTIINDNKTTTSLTTTIPTIEDTKISNNIKNEILNIDDLIKTKPEFIIVTFSTKEYLTSAISWYNSLTNININNHYIIVPQNLPLHHIHTDKHIRFIKSNTNEKKQFQK